MCAQTYWTCWVDSNAGWIIIIQQLHLMFEFHVENFTWKKKHTSLNRITHDQINAGKVISNAINFVLYISGLFAENGRFLILIDWFRTDALLVQRCLDGFQWKSVYKVKYKSDIEFPIVIVIIPQALHYSHWEFLNKTTWNLNLEFQSIQLNGCKGKAILRDWKFLF